MKKLLGLVLLFAGITLSAQDIELKNLYTVNTAPKKMEDAPAKVYIRSFKVYYQMIAEAEKTNHGGRQFGGGAYKGDATARMCVAVKGVDPEQLQQLTNDLYNQFVAQLKAENLEVYTADEIPAIEFYEGWEKITGPHINEEQLKGYLMVAPANYSYYVKRVTEKGKEKDTFIDKAYKVSEELEDMIVADVNINVASLWLDASAKLGSAKVKGGPFLRIAPGSTIKFQSGRLNKLNAAPLTASMVLVKKPLVINGVFEAEKFKVVADKQTTTLSSFSYAPFFTVNDVSLDVTNYAECDGVVYIEKVSNHSQQFMQQGLEQFKAHRKGEKYKGL